MTAVTPTLSLDPLWTDIRDGVRAVCAKFPNDYWVKLEHDSGYPSDFVTALTETGYLGAMIPEEFGGAGLPLSAAAAILETIHETGCTAAACHAQMYTMGTVLRHGNAEQKAKYLPKIASGELRLQAFGVTEPTTGSDTTQLKTRAEKRGNDRYIVNGQKVWTSRALHSDLMLLLARTTPADQVKKRSDGLSVFLVDLKAATGKSVHIKPIDAMINHNTCEVFIDNLEVPVENLIGVEGQGFKYIVSSMNSERILIARRMHRGWQFLHPEGERVRARPPRVRPRHRAEPGHRIPDCAGVRRPGRGRTDGQESRRPLRGRSRLRRGSQHGQVAGRRRLLEGGGSMHANLRRLRLLRGNTASSASGARRVSIRRRRFRPTWC